MPVQRTASLVLPGAPRPDHVARTAPGPFAELRPPLSDLTAVIEAERCLECGGPYAPAPCTVACPADVDVPGFIGAIIRGDPVRGGEIVFSQNLLGGTCARVCPVEILCEGACVLHSEGRRPVDIGRLQRHATDYGLASGNRARDRTAQQGKRVSVIGGGPAGLVCAGELAALGYAVTVYEAEREPGGLVPSAIAPYRQWRDPLPAEAGRIAELGVTFSFGRAIDAETLQRIESDSDAIFLGIGLGADVDMQYPGDSLAGIWSALPFIRRIKEGHPPPVGTTVAVIGGGNTAMDVAREALRLGARDVTVLYRRTEAEVPAFRHEVEEARAEGVRFQWLVSPVRFLGEGRVRAVECRYMRLGDPDSSGRRSTHAVPGTEFTIEADTVIKAVGQKPRKEFISLAGVEMHDGRIRIDAATGQTSNPRYFAGGDAVSGATVVEAVRGAKIAARGIHRMLSGEAS
jgi:dihydropyrimidine dehydrogenase (NAD+) subunit PreT